MSSIFGRCLGLNDGEPVPPYLAAILLQRRSRLARCEARVVVLDYLGMSREQVSEQLDVSIETIRTYWKRIYRKTACQTRADVYVLLETILREELGDDNQE